MKFSSPILSVLFALAGRELLPLGREKSHKEFTDTDQSNVDAAELKRQRKAAKRADRKAKTND